MVTVRRVRKATGTAKTVRRRREAHRQLGAQIKEVKAAGNVKRAGSYVKTMKRQQINSRPYF